MKHHFVHEIWIKFQLSQIILKVALDHFLMLIGTSLIFLIIFENTLVLAKHGFSISQVGWCVVGISDVGIHDFSEQSEYIEVLVIHEYLSSLFDI